MAEPAKIHVELTPAQLRVVNSALALLEADLDDPVHEVNAAVVTRTRGIVWTAFERSGVRI